MEGEGRRPVGWPKKIWSKLAEEDMRKSFHSGRLQLFPLNSLYDQWQHIYQNCVEKTRKIPILIENHQSLKNGRKIPLQECFTKQRKLPLTAKK